MHMRRIDGVRIAFASLLENPLRSFLTLLGIAISVTAVIFVVSVIQGLDLYMAESLSDLGPDVFVVERFGIIMNQKEWYKAIRRNPDVRKEDAAAMERLLVGRARVGVSRWYRASVKYRSKTVTNTGLRAVAPGVREMQGIDVEQGRPMTRGEIERAVPVCVLGHTVAQELFTPLDPIGRKVRIWGRSFLVAGVAEKMGSTFGHDRDNFLMIPFPLLEKIVGSRNSVSITVQVNDKRHLERAMDDVRSLMRARHHLRYDEEDDFGLVTSDAVMELWNNLTKMLFRVAIFVVSISLVVGGIVIMNIMLLTVVERTREIGVRKAIGARQCDIRFQFLAESVMLCTVGGAMGVGVGWLGAWGVEVGTPLPARFPVWAPILAVAVTTVVGIFFGLHPARQAADLDPIEALRSQST